MNKKALEQLQDEARKGDGFDMTLYGLTLIDQISSRESINKGLEMINYTAMDKNVIWAKCLLLYLRSSDNLAIPIAEKALVDGYALTQLRLYAEDGNMWAQAILGNLLYNGKTTVQNKEEASQWLYQSAKNGCLWAREMVSEYCIRDTGFIARQVFERINDRKNSKYWITQY